MSLARIANATLYDYIYLQEAMTSNGLSTYTKVEQPKKLIEGSHLNVVLEMDQLRFEAVMLTSHCQNASALFLGGCSSYL